MCRFAIYKGDTIKIADLVTRPSHSLVDQATSVVYTPGADQSVHYNPALHSKRNHAINADGFGLGWYAEDSPTPSLLLSIRPPWSDENLFEVAESTNATLVFAHVRAASPGGVVIRPNCHPFRMGKFMWMHNGGIGGFECIKRALLMRLRPDVYAQIKGSTDSEYAFALFVNQFPPQGVHGPNGRRISDECKRAGPHAPEDMIEAMRRTIHEIRELQRMCGVPKKSSYSSLNFAVTDGHTVIATRCRTHPTEDPPTLYYGHGEELEDVPSLQHANSDRQIVSDAGTVEVYLGPRHNMGPDPSSSRVDHLNTLVVASEPPEYIRTAGASSTGSWHLMPKDSLLCSREDGKGESLVVLQLDLPDYEDIPVVSSCPPPQITSPTATTAPIKSRCGSRPGPPPGVSAAGPPAAGALARARAYPPPPQSSPAARDGDHDPWWNRAFPLVLAVTVGLLVGRSTQRRVVT